MRQTAVVATLLVLLMAGADARATFFRWAVDAEFRVEDPSHPAFGETRSLTGVFDFDSDTAALSGLQLIYDDGAVPLLFGDADVARVTSGAHTVSLLLILGFAFGATPDVTGLPVLGLQFGARLEPANSPVDMFGTFGPCAGTSDTGSCIGFPTDANLQTGQAILVPAPAATPLAGAAVAVLALLGWRRRTARVRARRCRPT